MKSLSKSLLVLLLCLTTAVSFSQYTRPGAFSRLPDVIECSSAQFSNAFNASVGETITFSFANDFIITGKVTSNVQKYANLQSITIQVPQYENALFHLSKQINEDKSISFVGRILSTESVDGLEIKKDSTGNYTFQKIEEKKLRQLCSL